MAMQSPGEKVGINNHFFLKLVALHMCGHGSFTADLSATMKGVPARKWLD